MFDIEFVSEPTIEFGELSMRGRITLGTFTETFVSPLVYWSANGYREHWLGAAQHLLNEHDRTVFFTTMYSPKHAGFLFSWPMWRVNGQVCVQHQILFLEELKGRFDPQNPYSHIGHLTESSDQQPISTWLIQIEDIEAYIQRRSP